MPYYKTCIDFKHSIVKKPSYGANAGDVKTKPVKYTNETTLGTTDATGHGLTGVQNNNLQEAVTSVSQSLNLTSL